MTQKWISKTKWKYFEMKIMSYFIDVKMKKKKEGATGVPIAEIS